MNRSPNERSRPSGHGRRKPRRRTLVRRSAVASLLVAVGAGAVGLQGALGSPSGTCPGGVTLRVAAADDLAPVLAERADRLGGCDDVVVEAISPLRLVSELRAGRIRPPDVWVPDSSLWLDRAGVDALTSVSAATPVATSPLVLALTPQTARQVGRSGRQPTVSDLVRFSALGGLRLVTSGERLSPARVGAVAALAEAVSDRPDARAALAALLRTATPVHGEPDLPDTTGDLVPTSEKAVLDAYDDGVALSAVYPGQVGYDFPLAVLTADPRRVRLADRLLGEMLSAEGQAAVRAAGLRDLEGRAEPRPDERHTHAVVTPRALTDDALDLAEETLTAVKRKARLLAVLDVSGSMAWPVAGRDGAGPSRITIATGAAGQGLGLYPDGTEVGLWLFPSQSGGAYRQVSPVSTIDSPVSRAGLTEVLEQVAAVPGGDTPLYDATLAAVRAHRAGWEPGAVNAVVVLSDGADTASRTRLPELLSRLRAVSASSHPVPVITIGFGPDTDLTALAAIAKASGGAAYRASDAAGIRRIFNDALGQRACRPHCG
jgi:Ca-activated chloride channel family protein